MYLNLYQKLIKILFLVSFTEYSRSSKNLIATTRTADSQTRYTKDKSKRT